MKKGRDKKVQEEVKEIHDLQINYLDGTGAVIDDFIALSNATNCIVENTIKVDDLLLPTESILSDVETTESLDVIINNYRDLGSIFTNASTEYSNRSSCFEDSKVQQIFADAEISGVDPDVQGVFQNLGNTFTEGSVALE